MANLLKGNLCGHGLDQVEEMRNVSSSNWCIVLLPEISVQAVSSLRHSRFRENRVVIPEIERHRDYMQPLPHIGFNSQDHYTDFL